MAKTEVYQALDLTGRDDQSLNGFWSLRLSGVALLLRVCPTTCSCFTCACVRILIAFTSDDWRWSLILKQRLSWVEFDEMQQANTCKSVGDDRFVRDA